MPGKKEPSVYDLLNAKLIFTDEPLWFRILLYLITALFMIVVIWALHEWAIPTFLALYVGPKINALIRALKGRSP
jgi:hypothetical protein